MTCSPFPPRQRHSIVAPRHDTARYGIQRRRLPTLPDPSCAPRASRSRGPPRPPRRLRPPRVVRSSRRSGRGDRGREGCRRREGIHARRSRGRRAPRRGPRVRRAKRARCASTVPPKQTRHAPAPIPRRDDGAHRHHPSFRVKTRTNRAEPPPLTRTDAAPSRPLLPSQRPRAAASSTAAAPSSSAATTSPARTSWPSTVKI